MSAPSGADGLLQQPTPGVTAPTAPWADPVVSHGLALGRGTAGTASIPLMGVQDAQALWG